MTTNQEDREELVDGVRLMHYSSFTKLILDRVEGRDWAEYANVETFANVADTVTLLLDGNERDDPNGDNIAVGDAQFFLTPAEARWLGRKLVECADQCDQQAVIKRVNTTMAARKEDERGNTG